MKTAQTYLLVLILFFFSGKSFSQTVADSVKVFPGKKIVTMDPTLERLMKKQEDINGRKQTIAGYRVQLFFGTDRQAAEKIRTEFRQKYPDVGSYMAFQPPNFKIRAGDFRTRLEAQKFLHSVRGQYATSFVVTDEVLLPPLN